MLVHIKEIIQDAARRKYAVGAFNTVNLETTLAIVRAAVAMRSPVIIQISEKTIQYAELKPIADVIRTVARHVGGAVPIAMHFDHGRSFGAVRECVDAGFTSVHIDASDLPYDDNVAVTNQAVAYAHQAGVWVQGELGTIYGKEGLTAARRNPSHYMTDPTRVRAYVAATRVDTLAVSVGTLHGSFVGQERIDSPRLAAIARAVKTPLVLHGGSGVTPTAIRAAIRRGIRIINVDTDLRIAFTQTLRRKLRGIRGRYDLRAYFGPASEAAQRVVEQKISLFGCACKVKLSAR